MANKVYPSAKDGFLTGDISWTTNAIKAVLVDTGQYTYGDSHANLSDVPAGARVATSTALTGKTVVNNVADAADVTLGAVSGATVEAIVVFKDTGSASTSRLICFLDTGANLPVIPNGGSIDIAWDNGTNRIFKI